MELAKTNDNSFDPTPKLKTSPMLIWFIPFDHNREKCDYCGLKFSKTIYCEQKYCKNCLNWYVKDLPDNFIYLDVHIGTNSTKCNEHEPRNSNFYAWKIK